MRKGGLTRRESAAGSGLPDPAHRHSGLPQTLPAPLQDDLKELLGSLSTGHRGLRLPSSARSSWCSEHYKLAAIEGLGAGCNIITPHPQLRSSLPNGHLFDETCPDHDIQAAPQTLLPRTTEVSCCNRLSVTPLLFHSLTCPRHPGPWKGPRSCSDRTPRPPLLPSHLTSRGNSSSQEKVTQLLNTVNKVLHGVAVLGDFCSTHIHHILIQHRTF